MDEARMVHADYCVAGKTLCYIAVLNTCFVHAPFPN